jgi:quinoprotein dehydrogenase-associated probable ABC transporter substrate-binding protein
MRATLSLLFCASVLAGPAWAQRAELLTQTELRVCADPHNLPFSNDQKAGFENKVAAIIAADLELPLTYVWFPQTVGFVRNTLRTRACDLVMGAVAGDAEMDTTSAYYRAGYMLVTRAADGIAAHAVDDPALATKRFGYIAATPPTDLLLKHKLLDHATSYALTVDTRVENPARQMLTDLLDDKIDVALVWGPIVQYAITDKHLPLKAVMLDAEPDEPRLDYAIAMGVRANEPEWRRRINQALARHRAEIDAVMASYGIEPLKGGTTAKP